MFKYIQAVSTGQKGEKESRYFSGKSKILINIDKIVFIENLRDDKESVYYVQMEDDTYYCILEEEFFNLLSSLQMS